MGLSEITTLLPPLPRPLQHPCPPAYPSDPTHAEPFNSHPDHGLGLRAQLGGGCWIPCTRSEHTQRQGQPGSLAEHTQLLGACQRWKEPFQASHPLQNKQQKTGSTTACQMKLITNQAHSQTQVTTFGFISKKTLNKQWHLLFMAAELKNSSWVFLLWYRSLIKGVYSCSVCFQMIPKNILPFLNQISKPDYLGFSHSIKAK